jgi:hypothetical protein
LDTICTDCERDVDPAIDEDFYAAASLRGCLSRSEVDLLRVREQGGALEVSLANLHPIHTGAHRGRYAARQITAYGAAVDDEAEDRIGLAPFGRIRLRQSKSRVQKLANPSSGLEADA